MCKGMTLKPIFGRAKDSNLSQWSHLTFEDYGGIGTQAPQLVIPNI